MNNKYIIFIYFIIGCFIINFVHASGISEQAFGYSTYTYIRDIYLEETTSFQSALSESVYFENETSLEAVWLIVRQYGTPNANFSVRFYGMEGSYSTNAHPNNTLYCESEYWNPTLNPIEATYLGIRFNFTGENRITLKGYYCLTIVCVSSVLLDASNELRVVYLPALDIYSGNMARYYNDAWTDFSSYDMSFIVESEILSASGYTESDVEEALIFGGVVFCIILGLSIYAVMDKRK